MSVVSSGVGVAAPCVPLMVNVSPPLPRVTIRCSTVPYVMLPPMPSPSIVVAVSVPVFALVSPLSST
ncbi:hypothetical protein D3C83_260190 [compost metagenome]